MYHKAIITNLKEKDMKKVCIAFAMIALFLCFAVSPASAQAKGKCYQWYWDWTGVGEAFEGPAYMWLDGNGTFVNSFAETGIWYDNSGARVLVFDSGDNLWAGKKNRGFMYSAAVSTPEAPYGIWYNKGTKKSNCDFMTTTLVEGGPSMSSAK